MNKMNTPKHHFNPCVNQINALEYRVILLFNLLKIKTLIHNFALVPSHIRQRFLTKNE